MVSAETKMAVARISVVLYIVAAAACIGAFLRLPIFTLHIDSLDSSITQSLFTTDLYTPVAEKHVPVLDFTKKCEKLQMAFRVAQVSTIVAIVAFGLAFLCGLFHLVPSFTKTNRHIRRVCGGPICFFLIVALIAIGIDGYLMNCMYAKDTWCSWDHNESADFGVVVVGTPRVAVPAVMPISQILREPNQPVAPRLSHASVHILSETKRMYAPGPAREEAAPFILRINTAAADALDIVNAPLNNDVVNDDKKERCNPFDGCVASYAEMGFVTATGYNVVWAALTVAACALLVEMMVMVVGASVVPQAGVAAETAALLHREDDERVI